MLYKCVPGASVDFASLCLQRRNDNPAGYEIWAGLAGHVFGQLLRSLLPTMTTSQKGTNMSYAICVFLLARLLRNLCSTMTTFREAQIYGYGMCAFVLSLASLSLSLSLFAFLCLAMPFYILCVGDRDIAVCVCLCACLLSGLCFARSAYSLCIVSDISCQKSKPSRALIAITIAWCVAGSFAQPCLRSCV